MINDIEKLRNFLEDEDKAFDIYKKLLRFSIINKDSGSVFSEFYNFDSRKAVLNFIKKVVIPSISISILMEENGDIVITAEDKENFLNILNYHDVDIKLVEICQGIYYEIERLENKQEEEIDMLSLIDIINYEFSEGNFTMLSVDYAEDTRSYLKIMYNDYKEMGHVDVLEAEMERIGFSMDDFKDMIDNIQNYKDFIKADLLNKLPY